MAMGLWFLDEIDGILEIDSEIAPIWNGLYVNKVQFVKLVFHHVRMRLLISNLL